MSTSETPLAIFDLDGTLVRGDTFLPFLLSYAWQRQRFAPLLSLPAWLSLYAIRILSDEAAKQRVLISFLRGQSRQEVARHAEWFCQTWVRQRLRDSVLQRLHYHQQASHRVILLSASPEVYVPAIGHLLGIQEVLCTRVAGDAECWQGQLLGSNCKGQAKVQRLIEHLQRPTPPAGSWAYGDSRSDLPLLRWVEHGRLVRRDRLLPVAGA